MNCNFRGLRLLLSLMLWLGAVLVDIPSSAKEESPVIRAVSGAVDLRTPIQSVPLVALLANPDKYDGKLVRVSGFLHHKFEDNHLYVSKDDADYSIVENGIPVSYSKDLKSEPKDFPLEQFDGAYVLMEGRFRHSRFPATSDIGAISELIDVTRIRRRDRSYDGVRSTDSRRFDTFSK